MDIERGAPKALVGFDIQRWKPKLICIEAGAGEDYHEQVRRYFAQHAYERIDAYLAHDWGNWYYRPVD